LSSIRDLISKIKDCSAISVDEYCLKSYDQLLVSKTIFAYTSGDVHTCITNIEIVSPGCEHFEIFRRLLFKLEKEQACGSFKLIANEEE
jgi:hypothetical protein